MSVFRTSTAVAAAAGLLALGACTSGGGSTGSSTAGSTGATAGGPIAVTATDTECTVSAVTAAAGTITFQVKNTGTKVNEFYLYGAGDRIVSEVENITPGLTRELKVEVTEPGTFQTACKPGMVGDGIRAAFTHGIRGFAGRLAALMPGGRRQSPEDAALAAVAGLVGALILARAVDDPALSDRILAATAERLTEAP